MAGYSGTPLAKKLGIKEGARLAIHEIPRDVKSELRDAISTSLLVKQPPFDLVVLFVKKFTHLKKLFPWFAARLNPAGVLWVAWPKKSSGVKTDLDWDTVHMFGLEKGLVDVKVCAVSEIWSGLKFVIRLKDRPKMTAKRSKSSS